MCDGYFTNLEKKYGIDKRSRKTSIYGTHALKVIFLDKDALKTVYLTSTVPAGISGSRCRVKNQKLPFKNVYQASVCRANTFRCGAGMNNELGDMWYC